MIIRRMTTKFAVDFQAYSKNPWVRRETPSRLPPWGAPFGCAREGACEAGGGGWLYLAGSTLPAGTDVRSSVTATDKPGSNAVMDTEKKL